MSRRLRSALLALVFGCGGGGAQEAPVEDRGGEPPPPPAGLAAGERSYEARCAGCHGVRGAGTEQGPPLVHRIYEPAHHGDAAFHLAVARGVRAHHWGFGDMAPVAGTNSSEVEAIVAYVRWLQRQAGIT